MASRCLLLFFVFLSLIGLSEEGCHDHFSIEYWKGPNMTDLIPLINATSTEKILNCTIWKNRNLTLFGKINNECFKHLGLEQMCNQIPEGNHKIHVFHLRCLYAKLPNVNYADDSKEIFGDCENFSSGINTFQQLWNNLDNDGTSAGATSVSPPTISTLWSTTTMTTSTPTISTSRRTTTLTTFTPTMSSSLGTTTSTSSRSTTLRSLLTPSTSTPTTTSTTSTPTISTSRNTTSLTTSPTTTSTSLRTTMSTATTLKSRRTTTSTRSPTTTSKSSLTKQSTAKGKIYLSNTATLQSPTDFGPCLPCSFQSVPHMSPRTETSTQTWPTASILGVVLVLSITGNLMQGLNSFLQKRKLNMKQKQMGAECICLNPDATVAEKSPEENLSYSNESVH